ncbi:hypothetical protein ANN_24824 [Periplaneta americana]|uniref:Uncharacterized protein n=1 Tax=Periplaneta americana TaxID=6978 RepID=A0ABQ8RZW0_PERAM|nr:hypothetical protein ANN_24824 [Periplaneta americana]
MAGLCEDYNEPMGSLKAICENQQTKVLGLPNQSTGPEMSASGVHAHSGKKCAVVPSIMHEPHLFGIKSSYFFKETDEAFTVTSDRYVEMLEDSRAALSWNQCQLRMISQDGATAHTTTVSITMFKKTFPNNVISKGGEVPWPARSPDLSAHPEKRSGRPSLINDDRVELVRQCIMENRRFTITELSSHFPQIS